MTDDNRSREELLIENRQLRYLLEKAQADEEVRETKEMLQFALKTIHAGAWDLDLTDHTAYRSLEHDRIFGYNELLPRWTYEMFLEHVLDEDRAAVDAQFQQAVATQGEWRFQCRIRRVDNEVRWIFAAGCHRSDSRGGMSRMAGVVQDITERIQAEEQLLWAKNRLELVLDSLPVGVAIAEDPECLVISTNPAAARMFGAHKGENVSASSAKIPGNSYFHQGKKLQPEEMPLQLAVFGDCDITNMEIETHLSDGRRWTGLVNAIPLHDRDGKVSGGIAVIRDISQRKQAEAALRNSEELYRAVGELIDYGVWVCDPDGRNIYASPSFLKLVGLTQEQCSNFGWGDVLHPEDAENTIAAWKECARTGNLWNIEHRFRGVDGLWHPVLARGIPVRGEDGNILFWGGINLDISELKHAENVLRESQERLALATDAGQVGIFDLDMQTNELFWTAQHEKILGYEPTTGNALTRRSYKDWSDRVHPEDLPHIEQRMQQAMLEHTPFQIEYRVIWSDGSLHWVNVTSRFQYDSNGLAIRLIGAMVDITERRQMEESLQQYRELLEVKVAQRTAELNETNRLLVLQSRLAAMGEMINSIAHQWRQPLNLLGMNIQRLAFSYDMGDFSKELLDTSTRDAMSLIQHMSRTIDDFRDFFKPDKAKTYFSVNQAIQQTINLIGASFRSSQIAIETHLGAETITNGYPNEFAQAILNIMQNARDALVERNISNGRVTITSAIENGKTVVTVTDNAGGVAEDVIDKIFEPYFSTKGLQGTGIGLYMSKNIIETNMGGKVTVRNTGQGAEFRIEV